MIVFERFGHTFRIRNDDWKTLRKRFDIDNAIKEYDGWRIPISCSLCDKYDSYCPGCPIYVDSNRSCSWFLTKLFPKMMRFETHKYSIWWDKEYNITVRRQLKRMQEIIDKIEIENKEEK